MALQLVLASPTASDRTLDSRLLRRVQQQAREGPADADWAPLGERLARVAGSHARPVAAQVYGDSPTQRRRGQSGSGVHLERLERLLASTVERCSGGHVPDCPVIDMLDGVAP